MDDTTAMIKAIDAAATVRARTSPNPWVGATILSPTGDLVATGATEPPGGRHAEIVALDAQTLQPHYRFGRSLLDCVCAMVVAGEELFVCDKNNDRLQVFSLAGEHRRSITGAWKRPTALNFVKDRLYLVEEEDTEEGGDGELINPLRGRRIFVLSLQGETLQVYTHPDEGQIFCEVLCCFDGKLLAPVRDRRSSIAKAVVALGGLY